ncbi:MAG: hypothetical protein AB7S38_30315 [Vulcanimicrobiota bacterium]
MKVGSMPRQQAMDALRRRQQAALSKGDEQLAGTISQDLVTLGKTRGETVYDMYRYAQHKSERYEWFGSEACMKTCAGIGAGAGAAVGVGIALRSAQPALGGLVIGVFAGGILGMLAAGMMDPAISWRDNPGTPMLAALERSSSILASEASNPTPALPDISREEISEQLREDHQAFSDRGELGKAYQLETGLNTFSASSQMKLPELHAWAVEHRNEATVHSLHVVLSRHMTAEQLKLYLTGTDSAVDLSWLQDEVRVGDQSLPITQL